MALIGTGIVPSGNVGNELVAVTRRAFIPKSIVQIYKATPTLSAALANAQTASGGVSSITVPVQGAPFVTAQATDYSGSFNAPSNAVGMSEADWNLCAVVVPIPFLGMEGIVQLSAAVIPLIEARMNDAGNQVADYLSTQLWTNGTNGTINVDGFPLMMSASGTYGNIDRTANSFWQANARSSAGASPTRLSVLTDIVSAMNFNGGEMPNIGVTDAGTWAALAQDFVGQEQYMITPGSSFDQSNTGARAAFTALMVAGVPIYIDPYAGDGTANNPAGTIRYFNTRYFSAYIHEAAAFAFTGFASTLPNYQLGYVGCLVAVLQFVCVKPKSMTTAPGYTALTL
jgi:hypothetical protein